MAAAHSMHRPERRRAREGAVMVEAVLVISVLAAFFAWSLYMHRVGVARVDTLYTARRDAWRDAVTGCTGGGFDLRGLVTSFTHNENTDSTGFLGFGSRVVGSSTRTVRASSPLSATATLRSTVVLPCALVGSDGDPIGDPTGWVLDLFR